MSTEENTTQEEQVVPEEPHFVEPSKSISYTAKGEEYLEFQWISDRLVFPGKIAARQRDREIVKLALSCLKAKMQEIQAKSGSPFVPSESLKVDD
ncbi:hypothetical protein HAQ00_12560 [Acidithiobacillus caldus ATCC 51756]|jgi:hypothetical protein|uniref:hypothetical protein n=1 Tax=Acidithiobacillus caldus TaxID=33059 RepID=UPI001C06E672|nr:hypothetical protein [Acidithiobacillus caldus]MBU2736526.1 hypothetical protein [Acidithiobacillus caldus ATCC 51756]MBU2801673.1 hypothetical protein [Acidithiobacillus caldus]